MKKYWLAAVMATIRMANNREISGGASANEMNRDLRTGRTRSRARIACYALCGTAIALLLLRQALPR